MSEFKGTKGKWFISGITEIISMPNQTKISKVGGETYEESKANALLIIKAPEMLEMLTDAVNEYKAGERVSDGWYKAVEKLIKQATEL